MNFLSYFGVSVPFMWLLAFYFEFRINGILLGYIVGVCISLGFNAYLLFTRKWESCEESDDDSYYQLFDEDLLPVRSQSAQA